MTTENLPEVPEKVTALEVYQTPNGLDPWIAKIRAEAESFIADVSTKKGRDEIASMAYKISRSKTALDNLGKELVAELKELPKKIDAERARVRSELDALRDQVRQPLTDWEAEQARKEEEKKLFIENLKSFQATADIQNSRGVQILIADLESIEINESLGEYETQALHTKESALKKLREIHAQKLAQEQQQAELEKLRAEAAAREQADKEARIAKEAEERAIKAAELKAKQEREAAERRELELKLQAEKAEREKLEAQQRAEKAIEEEKLRVKREEEKAEAERLKREADKAHNAAINRAAKEDFIAGGMTEECAILAVTLIARKQIRNVRIDY